MPFVVEQDKALGPIVVGCFCPDRIMLESHHFADVVQELELGVWDKSILDSDVFVMLISKPIILLKPY
jgi:hypothetical protein